MAEKLTPAGLVVGLIPEEEPQKQEKPVKETPVEEQPEPVKRGRKPKA